MRLLECNDTGHFGLIRNIADNDIPKYAILSHTWGADKDEVTFQDIMNNKGRDKSGYRKLEFCGEQAKRDGLRYFWVDTCCIDKSSSAELQESINSMFRWYQSAAKCYVYLSDVSTNDYDQTNFSSWQPAFRKSRWFTRGWTLQELIAPRSVEFFCSNGKLLGDKESLQQQLYEITGIEKSALQGQDLSEFSVDQRMSWARNRKTKREEDKAYSLMGIFDVYMPLLYAEGASNAFTRLQEEIQRRARKRSLGDLSTFSTAAFNPNKRSKPSHDQSSIHDISRPQDSNPPERIVSPGNPTHSIDDPTKQSIIGQLYFTKIDERLTSLTAAQGKTCRWFLAKSEYTAWNDASKQEKHGGFLWIKGNPGTGKSTLMKLLFEEAKLNTEGNSSRITLSFFFLARGTVEERTTTGLYRSLLHQLFEKMPELSCSLDWMTADGARGIERNGWNQEALKHTLKHAVPKLGSRPLMIFVDALDECDPDQARGMVCLFEDLCELAENSGVTLQICFSSRHYPTIFIQRGLELTLENEDGHMEDIKHYIKSKLRLVKSQQVEALRSEILEKSSGIFLWVVLVLDILNSEYPTSSISTKKIRERLREIPPGLTDLFEMILKRDGENLEELQLCLKLILFAARPLKPEELYYATQLLLDENCTGYWDPEDVDLDQMKLFVRSSSKGLAEVTRNKSSDVQFIHESVRDFLLGKYEAQWSGVSGNFVGHGHELLRNCCLAQLCASTNQEVMSAFDLRTPNFWECRNMKFPFVDTLRPAIRIPPSERSNETQSRLQVEIRLKFPFLDYSVMNVLCHSNIAQQNAMEQGAFLVKFSLRLWVFINNYLEKHEVRRYTDSVTIPYILAEKNLADLLRIYPQKESCFDVTDQRYGPSILAALATGSHEAVQALLDIEAKACPTTSVVHDLCKQYHRKANKDINVGRRFTYSRQRDVLSYLSEDGQEIPLMFLLSSQLKGLNLDEHIHGGETLLTNAAKLGNVIIAKFLLERGIDVNHTNRNNKTPLQRALSNGHTEIVKLLLENGADINCINNDSNILLQEALSNEHMDIVKLLLENGADINYANNYNNTSLLNAASNRHTKIVKLLLENGADINYTNNYGNTPLLEAATHGHMEIVKLLLENGADVNCTNNDNDTPLLKAVYYGHTETIKLLLEKGADSNFANKYNDTPLLNAASNGHTEIVKLLLENSADVNFANNDNDTPLLNAVRGGHVVSVTILLEQGANITSKDKYGNTPLSLAVKLGHLAIIEQLLERNPVIDSEDNDGRTPLAMAVVDEREDIVKLLLDKGANIELENKYGLTPLLYAFRGGDRSIPIVKVLLDHGANVNSVNKRGDTPLSGAVRGRHLALLEQLLARNPDIDPKDDTDRTPLGWAIIHQNKDIVKLLLDKGADIELRDRGGRTPLLFAIIEGYGYIPIVKVLLDHGANINYKDKWGNTPLSYAIAEGYDGIVDLLKARVL
ncbi:hypothetical protein OCU04_011132 [Sclerotinia nivalis]|uniref:Heterokaryon incompatibility domain-containing protein n=1 Tax=Sclerotinia nivalis TaxID=352851 RepID=A0A9X0AB41_9HELO|nr:hypothetical protein OCU04_011132 [Sclerotinia nivalis]